MKIPPSTPQRGAASARLLIGIGVAGFFFIVLLNLFGTRLRTVRTTDPRSKPTPPSGTLAGTSWRKSPA